MQGKPVFPMMMRKLPSSNGRTAVWKEFMESGVRVKPRSLNIEAGVNMPLGDVSTQRKENSKLQNLPPCSRLPIAINHRAPSTASNNPRKEADNAQHMERNIVG